MSADLPERRLRAGDTDRDHVLAIVQAAYEAGRLDLDEMRDRQEKALKSKYTDELPSLVADLPEGAELMTRGAADVAFAGADYEALPATAPGDGGFTAAIMSGTDITVEPGTRDIGCLSFWGGNDYDLTRAMGPGRIVTMTLHSIMGGCNVYVPPGVRVIDQSISIMGGNGIKPKAQGDGSNGTVVIKGLQFWGGNDVKLRD